jgi:hypothetical protein
MHRTTQLTLLGLCLFVGGVQAAPGPWGGWGRPPRREVPARPVIERTFDGYGSTVADAKQHALDQAREWLAEQGGFGWTPPEGYLLANEMVRFDDPREQQLVRAGPIQVVPMHLEVTAAQAEKMREEGRRERMVAREWLFGRILAGVLGVVVVCAGYLRLEEMTRGYYARILRTAAGILLVLVCLGLLLVG